MVSLTMKFSPEFHQDLLPFVDVGAFEAQHDRQFHVGLARGFDHASGERIDAQDAAENIDQDGLHILVAEQNFEGVRDLLGIGAAADIEKVRGHAAGVLDDVHGRHGQAGAVDHAADVAVELDVVQAVLRSLDFERIFFGDVAQFAQIGMAEERVVVESRSWRRARTGVRRSW